VKKEGGMPLCENCLKRICKQSSPVPGAFEKSLESGYYKECKDKKCFVCKGDAKWFVGLDDAMGAIKRATFGGGKI